MWVHVFYGDNVASPTSGGPAEIWVAPRQLWNWEVNTEHFSTVLILLHYDEDLFV